MEQNNSLKEKILQKIRANEVPMRSRTYFVLRIAAVAALACLVFLISIFILNFIAFSIRINSADSFLSFGPRGVLAFLLFFPWLLLLADIALIALLVFLLRQFRFGYLSPTLYLLLGLLVFAGAAGFVLDRATDVNERLYAGAQRNELPPPIGAFYGTVRMGLPAQSGVCKCVIANVQGNTITVYDRRFGTTTTFFIQVPPNDPRATTTGFEKGDVIFVAGEASGTVIKAFGVRKVDPDFLPEPLQ